MAVTKEQVAELYVAYFNRAPDTAGLDYWVGTGSSLEEISSSFYVQPETKTNYPDTMSDSVFVNTIYKNVFNRDAEPNGLVYWENELANEIVTRPNMILAIVNGAKDTDTTKDDTILANKTEVGLYSANAGVNDVTKATDVMKDVDETQESVDTAKAVADNYAVLILTVKQDTIVGSTKDDTINGMIASTGTTYTAGDTIDGGDGNDTFRLQVSATVSDVSAQINNVETIEIFGTSSVGTISGFNWNGVKNYKFSGDNNQTVANIKDVISSVTIDKATKSDVIATINFLNKDVVDTDNDTLEITLSNSTKNTNLSTQVDGRATDMYEELSIHSISNVGASLTVNKALDVKKVTIDGNSDMNITLSSASNNEILDASALTGKLLYRSVSTTDEIVKGGSNNDDINVTKADSNIWGGAGKDKILGGSGSSNIWGGDGDDNITAGATASVIYGGAGKDTISGNKGVDNFKYDNLSAETGLTTETADVISLTPSVDKISFRGLDAGTSSNFFQTNLKTDVTSVETAVTEANKGILQNKMYVEYTNNNSKYLVIDATGDGKANAVLDLNETISYSDIGIY